MKKTTVAVHGYITQKKKLEFDLANAIRDHFNTGTLKIQMNTMISNAVQDMVKIKGWDKVWNKNKGVLKALGRYGDHTNVIRHADNASINPEDCGDIIRLFGEVLEDAEKGGLDRSRRAAQLGGDNYWDKPSMLKPDGKTPYTGYDVIAPKMNLTTGKYPKPPGTRVRMGTTEKLYDMSDTMLDKIRVFERNFNKPSVRKVKPLAVESREPSEMNQIGGGMIRWIPQANDLLYRIESTFGLRIGATISGTTTDTIFFLNRYMRDLTCIAPDPIFYLLPIATIVSQGHHSLIETALPLALHNKINYSIGLYSGLLPLDSRHYATGAIRKTLQQFENDQKNRLMLIFFSRGQVVGGSWEFDKIGNDRTVFERMAKADENMLKMFANLHNGYATELMIDGWYRKARRGQLNSPVMFI